MQDPNHDTDGKVPLRDFDLYEIRKLLSGQNELMKSQNELMQNTARLLEGLLVEQEKFSERLNKIEESSFKKFCSEIMVIVNRLTKPEALAQISTMLTRVIFLTIMIILIVLVTLGFDLSGLSVLTFLPFL